MKLVWLLALFAAAVPMGKSRHIPAADEAKLDAILRMLELQQMNEDEESQSRTEEESESETTAVGGMEAWMEQEQSNCATDLYVLAFTHDEKNSGTDKIPYLNVEFTTGDSARVQFPNYNYDEIKRHYGDFFRFALSGHLGRTDCITKDSIDAITIISGGTDGWKIASVFTMLRSGHYFTVVTADVDLNLKIKKNNPPESVTLTKTS